MIIQQEGNIIFQKEEAIEANMAFGLPKRSFIADKAKGRQDRLNKISGDMGVLTDADIKKVVPKKRPGWLGKLFAKYPK